MIALNRLASPVENGLLAALPSEEFERLRPQMRTVQLRYKQTIHRSGESIRWVYFPITAVVALTSILQDGSSAELGLVGCEGMAGLSALLGSDSTPFDVVVQIPGTAYQMCAGALTEEAGRPGPLGAGLLRYTLAFLGQVAQGISCTCHHDVTQRLARYLLMMRDRVATDRLPLTHEFLGQMLGVGRPSVTLTLDALQKAGLVRLSRGNVTVVDPQGLEAMACECYQSIRDEYSRLLLRAETRVDLHDRPFR